MTRGMRLWTWPAALLGGIGLAGCAPQTDFSAVSTSPVAMVCDGGRTFTVSYANGFETAVVEAEGRRLELPRVRTGLGLAPNQAGFGARTLSPGLHETGDVDDFDRPRDTVGPGEAEGVRYGSDEAFFISRNRAAVLEVGDQTYSNCRVAQA